MNFLLIFFLLLTHCQQFLTQDLQNSIQYTTLQDGMNIVVVSNKTATTSVQLFIDCKAKKDKKIGKPHFIEHMLFKGTKNFSESDIGNLMFQLSGKCNALTTHDYVQFETNLPNDYWSYSLPIIKEILTGCTIKDHLFYKERGIILEELNMIEDDLAESLKSSLMSEIFKETPYGISLIGTKKDLYKLTPEDLRKFYTKNFKYNKATIVVAGDVTFDEIIKAVQKNFLHTNDTNSTHNTDTKVIAEKSNFNFFKPASTNLFRNITESHVALAYVVPGLKTKNYDQRVSKLLEYALTGSYYTQLSTDTNFIETECYNLFDYGLFFIHFEPKKREFTEQIIANFHQILADIAQYGLTQEDINRYTLKERFRLADLKEKNDQLAFEIGDYFLARGNFINLGNYNFSEINKDLQAYINTYMKPDHMHAAHMHPFENEEQSKELYEEDEKNNEKHHLHEIEKPKYILNPLPAPIKSTFYSKPTTLQLPNGLKVVFYNNPESEKVFIQLHTESFPKNQALHAMLINILSRYPQTFGYHLKSYGVLTNFDTENIKISALAEYTNEALQGLLQIISNADLSDEAVEKTRSLTLYDVEKSDKDHFAMAMKHIIKNIYQDNPSNKYLHLDQKDIDKITHQDILDAYKNHFQPNKMTLAIIGNLSAHNIEALIKNNFESLNNYQVAEKLKNPTPISPQATTINCISKGEQVSLFFALPAVNFLDEDFASSYLFDFIFSKRGDHSVLFSLRKKSGLIYDITCSGLSDIETNPSIVCIKTSTAPENVETIKELIINTIQNAADNITEEQMLYAKRFAMHDLNKKYTRNEKLAELFLQLSLQNVPFDFYDKLVERFEKITKETMTAAVKKIFDLSKLVTVIVGPKAYINNT